MCVILIADDDKSVLTNLTYILSSEGFTVLTANNGWDALKLAAENIPDVIITDIHMPVLDGFQLQEELKDNPVTSEIPLIFISADAVTINDHKDLSGSKLLFISKPFLFEDIIKAVNSLKPGREVF